MLNISNNKIDAKVNKSLYKSFTMVYNNKANRLLARLLSIFFALFLILCFLPWTQNIQSQGFVTTLQPDQRPQSINSIIGGRIEKWNITEGDYVKKGDTILFISEIKDEYFDPQLLSRTQDQIKSKELSVNSYMEKVKALDKQVDALLNTKLLKLEQGRNYIKQAQLKILSDSIDVEASITNLNIAFRQQERAEQLYNDGLKSLTDFETKKLKLQETQAKKISAENKLLNSRNELINTRVELNSLENQYRDKVSKAESEKFTAMSSMYDAEAIVTKMQGQYMNYSMRTGFYCITAPQTGFVAKTIRTGIGEVVKEGEALVTIMPAKFDLAVAMYVRPMDLPLLVKGQTTRVMFDGWPTIVFSGWPNTSYGTFGGKIVAIDNIISDNGMYRVLVAPDPNEHKWPERLRVGAGANSLTLLEEVPVWYELWRNLNGFPPDYYGNIEKKEVKK
jgi:adhesin transport system membrane fusion protein